MGDLVKEETNKGVSHSSKKKKKKVLCTQTVNDKASQLQEIDSGLKKKKSLFSLILQLDSHQDLWVITKALWAWSQQETIVIVLFAQM